VNPGKTLRRQVQFELNDVTVLFHGVLPPRARHFHDIPDGVVDIGGGRCELVLQITLGKLLQAPDGIGAIVHRLFDVLQTPQRLLFLNVGQQQLQVAKDGHEQVVEIVRYASGHGAQGGQLFRLKHFIGKSLLLGDIVDDQKETLSLTVMIFHCDQAEIGGINLAFGVDEGNVREFLHLRYGDPLEKSLKSAGVVKHHRRRAACQFRGIAAETPFDTMIDPGHFPFDIEQADPLRHVLERILGKEADAARFPVSRPGRQYRLGGGAEPWRTGFAVAGFEASAMQEMADDPADDFPGTAGLAGETLGPVRAQVEHALIQQRQAGQGSGPYQSPFFVWERAL